MSRVNITYIPLGEVRLPMNVFCAHNDSSSINNSRVKSMIFNGETSCFHSNLIKKKCLTKYIFGHCDPDQKKREKNVELFFVNWPKNWIIFVNFTKMNSIWFRQKNYIETTCRLTSNENGTYTD